MDTQQQQFGQVNVGKLLIFPGKLTFQMKVKTLAPNVFDRLVLM